MDRMPAACPLQTSILDLMRLCDSYWPEAHRDAKKMALLSLAASAYSGVENAQLPFDGAMDAEALGAKIDYADKDTAPFVTGSVIRSLEDVRQLDVEGVKNAGRVPLIVEAMPIIRKRKPDLPIVVTIQAPFTLSTQLRGGEMAMMDMAAKPEQYLDFIHFIARWSSFVAAHFIENGADAVMMVDSKADDSILGPELYESFALPGQRKVIESIIAREVPSMLHICGDMRSSTDLMVRSGVDAISIGPGMSIAATMDKVKGRCRVIGNIDTGNLLLAGSPKQVGSDVKRCIKEGVDMAAPCCGLSPKTPLENLKAMTNAVRKYGKKRS